MALRLWIFVVLAAGMVACGKEEQPLAPEEVRFRLTWETDADLELELWKLTADGETLVARSYELPGGGDDEVTGRGARAEYLTFRDPGDSETYLVAVSFWAVGPRTETDVTATVTWEVAGGELGRLAGEMNDDKRDLWFAYRIAPGSSPSQEDRYAFQNL